MNDFNKNRRCLGGKKPKHNYRKFSIIEILKRREMRCCLSNRKKNELNGKVEFSSISSQHTPILDADTCVFGLVWVSEPGVIISPRWSRNTRKQ